jgi:hypothetical protein
MAESHFMLMRRHNLSVGVSRKDRMFTRMRLPGEIVTKHHYYYSPTCHQYEVHPLL